MKKRTYLENKYAGLFIVLTVFVSTMMLFRVSVFTLFVVTEVLGIGFMMLYTHELNLVKDKYVNFIFLTLVIGLVFTMCSDIPLSYRKAALYSTILLIPTYFVYSIAEKWLKDQRGWFENIRKAIVFTCEIELVLCLVQYLLYYFAEIDLNQLIFVDVLHLTESASQYKLGVGFLPSGLCWHSAYMAPIVILSFLMSKKIWVKGLALLDAVICNNATALLGVCVCIALEIFMKLFIAVKKHDYRVKKNLLALILAAVVFAVPIMIKMNVFQTIWDKIWYIYERIIGTAEDGGSAAVHIRYYLAYPQVFGISTIPQILFGYGIGCSGYPITELFGQYAELKNWSVESDIMNLIYSRGLIGAACYYAFLIKIAVAGYRIHYKYMVLMLSIIVAGVTYNIQFDWLFLMELLIYLAVTCGYDFWEENASGRIE